MTQTNPPTPPVNLKQPRQGTRGPTNPNEMSRTLQARKRIKNEDKLKQVLSKIRKDDLLRTYANNPEYFHPMSDENIKFYNEVMNSPEMQAIQKDPEPMKVKSGGKVKNYGYMGGGKVYGRPRKANYKAG